MFSPAGLRPDMSLVGREAETTKISLFLRAVTEGPVALTLSGEAGMGKTTLWNEALAHARAEGYRVLIARPAPVESNLSVAGLADLLEKVLDDHACHLPSPQRHALNVALLREEVNEHPVDPRAVSLAALGVVRDVSSNGPVLVAVDDVNLLDAETSRILEYVVRRLDREPVGLLLTMRSKRHSEEPLNLARNLPEERVHVLTLDPLDADLLESLVRSRLSIAFRRSTIRELRRASGGNPLFALEISRAMLRQGRRFLPEGPAPVPHSLRELLRERLNELPAQVGGTLLVISAMSQPTVSLVAAAVGSMLTATDHLDEAIQSGVIEMDGDRLRFSHPLLASLVYSDQTAEARRELHRRLASVVVDLEQRARHLALATDGPDSNVAAELDEAARRAHARGAPNTGADLAEMARRLTPSNDVVGLNQRTVEAARFRFQAGETVRATMLLEGTIGSMPSNVKRAEALRLLGTMRSYASHTEAVALFEQGLREATGDPAVSAGIHRDLAWTCMVSGRVDAAEGHARRALELTETLDDSPLLAEAITAVGFIQAVKGRGLNQEQMERAVAIAERTEGPRLFRHPGLIYGIALKWSDRFDEARARFEAVRDQSLDRGDESSLPFALYHLSELECWAGNFPLAERYALDGLELAEQTGEQPVKSACLYARALVDARMGLVDSARAQAQEGLAIAEQVEGWLRLIQNHHVLGFLDLSTGHPEEAVTHLARAEELSRSMGVEEPGAIRFAGDEIQALIAARDLAEAERVLDWLEERSRDLDRAWGLVVAARGRALIAASKGNVTEAIDWLERAGREHGRLGDPFELARSLLALGTVQRRGRQKRAARASLVRAVEVFERLGARIWADRARAEMGRIGGRAAAPLDLTPTEQRVAELAGHGRHNAEIAASLFLSVRTVEVNLTRIYRKLGIRSRTELARRMLEDGAE